MKINFFINPKTTKRECRIGKNGQLFIKTFIVDSSKLEHGDRFIFGTNAEDKNDKSIYLVKSEEKTGSKITYNNHCWVVSMKYVLNELDIKYPCYVKVEHYKDEETEAIKLTPIQKI